MDKIGFQGKTYLVTSPQKYADRLKCISDQKKYNFVDNLKINSGIMRVLDINDGDIFVLVHNNERGMLRRIEYSRQLRAQNIINKICEDLKIFSSDLKENITCMILGGRSKDAVTTKCVNDVANSVEGYLAKKNEIKGDVSIICGMTDEVHQPMLFGYKQGEHKIPEIYIPTEIKGDVTAEKLEEIFDIVELNNVTLT